MEDYTRLRELAEEVKTAFQLNYDADSVKYIEGFIERQKGGLEESKLPGLINSLGSFLGQCIITNYGGHWERDELTQAFAVVWDNQNKVFPIAKTAEQFENGLVDSVSSFFEVIPLAFKTIPGGQGKTLPETDRKKTNRMKQREPKRRKK